MKLKLLMILLLCLQGCRDDDLLSIGMRTEVADFCSVHLTEADVFRSRESMVLQFEKVMPFHDFSHYAMKLFWKRVGHMPKSSIDARKKTLTLFIDSAEKFDFYAHVDGRVLCDATLGCYEKVVFEPINFKILVAISQAVKVRYKIYTNEGAYEGQLSEQDRKRILLFFEECS